MANDKTWNVFIDGMGMLMDGTFENVARKMFNYYKTCGENFDTAELVHGEQTVERFDK